MNGKPNFNRSGSRPGGSRSGGFGSGSERKFGSSSGRNMDRSPGGPGADRFERRRRYLLKAREDVRDQFTGKGASVVQSVRAIDDLDSAISLLFQRLKELSALNFPELKLDNEESYARVLREFGSREEFTEEGLKKLVGDAKAKELAEKSKASFGTAFNQEEKQAVQQLASAIAELQKSRKELDKFISHECGKVMRNVCTLIEPIVAARLLSAAGSLEKMASMPSSTIQVIGAEKSLFKHLRSGTPPPKHGIIFNCQIIRTAPKEKRGRIARVLAGKIAIAVKADAFTGNFIAEKLKADLEKALKK